VHVWSSVAEGIETDEQMERLKRAGVNMGQGLYFARPPDVECVEQFLETTPTAESAGVVGRRARVT
jgi:EAL domain-containing protein (putative c-di-GMP-specific phosphodiesterase class I)